METMKLGHSGIDVSVLCLGILPFGTKVDRRTSYAILDGYAEAGGRFVDTANNYSKWHPGGIGVESETTLGAWMKDRRNRSQFVVATKVGFNRDDIGPSLSLKTIQVEIEGSLRRLGTDYVDLYYAHADIRGDPIEETLAAFDALVRSGKVRAIGCSNFRAWRIERARNLSRSRGWAEYCCVQQRHTYLRPAAGARFAPQVSSNEDLLDYCRENRDVRLLAYSPLLGGVYGRPDGKLPPQYTGPDAESRMEELKRVASEHGATMRQVVYAWMLHSDPAIIPLTAPTSMPQLAENLKAVEVRLSTEQMRRLDEAGER